MQFSRIVRKKIQLWLCNRACFFQSRFYSSKVYWDSIRPTILQNIQNKANAQPTMDLIHMANDVFKTRSLLVEGVSTLLKTIPIKACKFCSELYVGHTGHLIKTCHAYKRNAKDQPHQWIEGGLNDILVPADALLLRRFFEFILTHEQKLNSVQVSEMLDLCCQIKTDIFENTLFSRKGISQSFQSHCGEASLLPQEQLRLVAQRTLEAWEILRSSIQRVLQAYPMKICKVCKKVRFYGIPKFDRSQGQHIWRKAKVDDLLPPKIVWRQRPQDSQMLIDSGRDFYGHAPIVIELCLKAGAVIPSYYFYMMKLNGLSPP